MLTQMPDIRLIACQPCTVDSGLLSRANTDSLSVLREAYGIGLRIFQRNQRDNQVTLCIFRQFLVFCYNIIQQRVVNLEIVPSLLECYAVNLFFLLFLRHIVRVNLYNIIVPIPFAFQNFKRSVSISRRNNAIRNLTLNQPCRCFVADIAQGNPVSKRRHSVRPSCTGIGKCQRRIVQSFDVVHKAGFFQRVTHRRTDCRRSRADMLKRRSRRHPQCVLDFLHQLPAVERVQKIDIAGSAA